MQHKFVKHCNRYGNTVWPLKTQQKTRLIRSFLLSSQAGRQATTKRQTQDMLATAQTRENGAKETPVELQLSLERKRDDGRPSVIRS